MTMMTILGNYVAPVKLHEPRESKKILKEFLFFLSPKKNINSSLRPALLRKQDILQSLSFVVSLHKIIIVLLRYRSIQSRDYYYEQYIQVLVTILSQAIISRESEDLNFPDFCCCCFCCRWILQNTPISEIPRSFKLNRSNL